MTGASLRENDGFTVLELIVCLGLLALMVSLMAEGLGLAQRGTAVIDRMERMDADRAVQTYLRRTLEGAVPAFSTREDGTTAVVFEGGSDRLRFVSRSNGQLEGGGFVLVEIRADDSRGSKGLVTERVVVEAASRQRSEPRMYRLLEGIGDLRFRYYGPPASQTDPNWSTEWSDPNTLPRLVEITLLPGESQNLVWPRLVVAIPIAPMITN